MKSERKRRKDCLFVGCLTSQQQASVSQGRISSDNITCCHTEREVADQAFYLIPSQYTDTGPTSPSADKRESNPGSSALEGDALTTRPKRRSDGERRRKEEEGGGGRGRKEQRRRRRRGRKEGKKEGRRKRRK